MKHKLENYANDYENIEKKKEGSLLYYKGILTTYAHTLFKKKLLSIYMALGVGGG